MFLVSFEGERAELKVFRVQKSYRKFFFRSLKSFKDRNLDVTLMLHHIAIHTHTTHQLPFQVCATDENLRLLWVL